MENRDNMVVLKRIRDVLIGDANAFPRYIADNPKHIAAVAALSEWTGKPGVDYAHAAEHAKLLWDRDLLIHDRLDDKADSIIKYLGGGTGLFTLGLISKLDASTFWVGVLAILPIAAAIVAVFLACRAKQPGFVPGLVNVERLKNDYLEGVEDNDDRAAALLAQWHLAIVDLDLANNLKADLVVYATWSYFAAVACLVAPLLAAIAVAAGAAGH